VRFISRAKTEATDLYGERSPMKYIKNVKTPTMIMHGQVDTRLPIAQSQEFYMALREMKVPVEFVVYPREHHGFTEVTSSERPGATSRLVLLEIPESASRHRAECRCATSCT
jgi:dipeptidyl aminopeptidase/acylaminoacyl peptidase